MAQGSTSCDRRCVKGLAFDFVHADLPGMDPGSIDVNMGCGVLT